MKLLLYFFAVCLYSYKIQRLIKNESIIEELKPSGFAADVFGRKSRFLNNNSKIPMLARVRSPPGRRVRAIF